MKSCFNYGVYSTLFLFASCSSINNYSQPLICETNSALVFQGLITNITYLDEEVFFEYEPIMATASLVDLRVLNIEKGDCTGDFVKVKLIETTPGRLNVRAKPKITIVDPMEINPPKFARWDFEG